MSARARILVAEDDQNVRELVRTRLLMAGYEVYVARNGIEAREQHRMLRPAAIVLDINMPNLDGFGLLESLRNRAKGVMVPVLVLSARHEADDVRRAISLGAKDYLTKPFNEGQLLARVARLLRPPIPAPMQKTG